MKTTFSYYPGMFENPAPAKIILKKQNQKKLKESLSIITSDNDINVRFTRVPLTP